MFSFADHFTRYCWVYMLKDKSEIPEFVEQFAADTALIRKECACVEIMLLRIFCSFYYRSRSLATGYGYKVRKVDST